MHFTYQMVTYFFSGQIKEVLKRNFEVEYIDTTKCMVKTDIYSCYKTLENIHNTRVSQIELAGSSIEFKTYANLGVIPETNPKIGFPMNGLWAIELVTSVKRKALGLSQDIDPTKTKREPFLLAVSSDLKKVILYNKNGEQTPVIWGQGYSPNQYDLFIQAPSVSNCLHLFSLNSSTELNYTTLLYNLVPFDYQRSYSAIKERNIQISLIRATSEKGVKSDKRDIQALTVRGIPVASYQELVKYPPATRRMGIQVRLTNVLTNGDIVVPIDTLYKTTHGAKVSSFNRAFRVLNQTHPFLYNLDTNQNSVLNGGELEVAIEPVQIFKKSFTKKDLAKEFP